MTRAALRGGAAVMLVAGMADAALAQRASQSPSAAIGAPSAPTPPPPGMTASPFVFGGEFETELQGEIAKPSHGRTKGEVTDESNLDLYGNYSSWLSLYGTFHLERNREGDEGAHYPASNSFFRSEGLTLRQLFAAVRPTDDVSVYGGKIHPAFGSAWGLEPGNFSTFASDYEQDERIGVGAEYAVLKSVGIPNLRISVETFFLDTSALSTSLLSMPALGDPTADRPFRYTRAQFGPSNTESFRSFTIAARGGQAERGLTYQLSVTREATDDPAGKVETGVSIGAMYDPTGDGIALGERLGVTPFLEYTHFDNFANTAGLERHYVIGGLTFTRVRWQYVIAFGVRKSEGASRDTDHQTNLSVNYTVTPQLSVGAGVNYIVVAGRDSIGVGPSLNFHIAF